MYRVYVIIRVYIYQYNQYLYGGDKNLKKIKKKSPPYLRGV